MEKRSTGSLVSSLLIIYCYCLQIVLAPAQALAQNADRGLYLTWIESTTPQCQKLIEQFLLELRSITNETPIDFEVVKPNSNSITLRHSQSDWLHLNAECFPKNIDQPISIFLIDDNKITLELRYLEKSAGFNPQDWLLFQERYLKNQPLKPEANTATFSGIEKKELELSDLRPKAASEIDLNKTAAPTSSLTSKWWFWTILGGLTTSAVITTLALTKNSGNQTNIEIK